MPLIFFRMKNKFCNGRKKRGGMLMAIIVGILAVIVGAIGVRYGVAAIIAGITAIGVGLGLKKD